MSEDGQAIVFAIYIVVLGLFTELGAVYLMPHKMDASNRLVLSMLIAVVIGVPCGLALAEIGLEYIERHPGR